MFVNNNNVRGVKRTFVFDNNWTLEWRSWRESIGQILLA